MKRCIIIIIIGLLGLTACTTYHGVKVRGVTPINPEVVHPHRPTIVENLQPTLEWKSSLQGEETYDVIIFVAPRIMDGGTQLSCQTEGEKVYYRERIKETYHKVEKPLEPNREYFWSVRVRKGDKVSEWSRYDYSGDDGYGDGPWGSKYEHIHVNNCWFKFKTPYVSR